MLGLQELHAVNRRTRIIRDNFNRECSFCQSRGGFVLHSGVHRSAVFVSGTEHPEAHAAFTYWSGQGQPAVDAFITALVGDPCDLHGAERAAFQATRPGWSLREVSSGGKLLTDRRELIATRPSGRLVEELGAYRWVELHERTSS